MADQFRRTAQRTQCTKLESPSGDSAPSSSPLQNPLWVLPVYLAPVIARPFFGGIVALIRAAPSCSFAGPAFRRAGSVPKSIYRGSVLQNLRRDEDQQLCLVRDVLGPAEENPEKRNIA